jgi:ribosomal protein S18
MARPASPSSKRARTTKDAARRPGKKKICQFCADKAEWVDYKDANLLRRFISDRGKIKARRVTGNCVRHQREVAIAIKSARELALIPYALRASSDRPRGGGRGRGGDESRGPRPGAAAPAVDDEEVVDGIETDEAEANESEA